MVKQLRAIVGKDNLKINYSLKKCSSFGIGGNATYFATPCSLDDLFNLIDFAEKEFLSYKIIGNGTNILFSDNGFKGLIISTKKIASCVISDETKIFAGAGANLSTVIKLAKNNSLSGLEFAVGIPGSIGGAVVMNAGTKEGEMSDVVRSVTVLENGDIRTIEQSQLEFSYRHSYFFNNKKAIILFVELELTKSTIDEIEYNMNNAITHRLKTQPKEKSAGCVFKKCGEIPAGLLIDQAGLKGVCVGGAKVSEVHANFIVNSNDATAKDVKQLIKKVKNKVLDKYNLELELEIEIIE